MRHFIAFAALAGCTMSAPPPDGGIVEMSMNGLLSLAIDGATQRPAGTDQEPSFAAQGNLYSTSDTLTLASGGTMRAYSANGLTLDAPGALSLTAHWNSADSFDITTPAAIQSLTLDTASLAEAGPARLTLGSRGGTLSIREIVPAGGDAWRIRGNYTAQACDAAACRQVTGTFAFTQSTLPVNGNIAALLSGG